MIITFDQKSDNYILLYVFVCLDIKIETLNQLTDLYRHIFLQLLIAGAIFRSLDGQSSGQLPQHT